MPRPADRQVGAAKTGSADERRRDHAGQCREKNGEDEPSRAVVAAILGIEGMVSGIANGVAHDVGRILAEHLSFMTLAVGPIGISGELEEHLTCQAPGQY